MQNNYAFVPATLFEIQEKHTEKNDIINGYICFVSRSDPADLYEAECGQTYRAEIKLHSV